MGKQVTVLRDFTDVVLPTALGLQAFNGGAVVVLTDAEYAALTVSTTRALSAPTTVADPARPSTDPQAQPLNTVSYASGGLTLKVGLNVVTLTASLSGSNLHFPTVPVGSSSTVDLVAIQGTGGSKTVSWTGSGAKFAGGTAPTLTTAAAGVDRLRFVSRGDGVTWDCIDSILALA